MAKYFSYSDYVDVEIDIDYDEALDAIGEDYVREWLGSIDLEDKSPRGLDLSNPVIRLEVINTLRAEGYTVEPA